MEAASSASSTSARSVEGPSVGGSADYLTLGMFSSNNQQQPQQQHSGDVLVGSGFGSALGNGFGNNDVTSGVGGVATSSSGSTATSNTTGTSFDLNDFPSLGGGAGGTGSNSAAGNGLAAALRQQQLMAHQQQQQQQQQQQMLGASSKAAGSAAAAVGTQNMYRLAMTNNNGNFNMATEDFPALSSSGVPAAQPNSNSSGAVGPGGSNGSLSGTSSLLAAAAAAGSTSAQSIARAPSNGGGLYGSGTDSESVGAGGGGNLHLEGAGAGLLGGTSGLTGLGGLRGLQQPQSSAGGASNNNNNNNNPGGVSSMSRAPSGGSSSAAPTGGTIGSGPSSASSGVAGSGSAAGSALQGDYGLLGLLGVIRMTDADRNALALGSDLTMLGLNLGSAEHIYSTFSSPWTPTDSAQPTKDPHYQLPSCYYMQPPALKTGHLSKFQLETLFYIFYALPKDVLQAYAAQELYSREWRYHSELKLWFKRAGPSDGLGATSIAPGQYLYFDINTWERRLFNGNMNQNMTNGFLPEEEIRVKFPNS
mmetsp:Transcript_5800/g.16266  ORF Transcript_5800/g.16266 Transcript_5800/m.16266 type:complete len:533 (+) Transcript_5800:89-1687(+)